MFERFTDRARRAVVRAEEEARRLHDTAVRPEHLLLALMEGDGVAAKALRLAGVDADVVRSRVAEATPPEPAAGTGPLKVPFSPRAKKTLELSLREALRLGHNYIGTEHLLLGALRESEADAGRYLGVDLAELRNRVVALVRRAVPDPTRSPATRQAEERAGELAARQPVTTGHLLEAILADPASHASRALGALGVTEADVRAELARTPLEGTSDESPRPRSVEIKLGEATTTIEDSDIAEGLAALSPEELRDVLRKALGRRRRRGASGAAG